MLSRKALFALLTAVLAFSGIRASAQAGVTESQTHYLYVDAQSGSDMLAGSKAAPLRTLQAAVDQAEASVANNIGTKIVVNPGVYRESLNLGGSSSTGATFTIQAAVTGSVVLDGSDVLSSWSRQSSGIYTHVWTPNLGTCGIPAGWPGSIAPIARRTEMLFVNGIPMTQVMAESELRPGTFYVNESSNLMYLDPPSGTNVGSANIEAAVRRNLLNIAGQNHVVVRGMVFRHAASCINTPGVTINNSSNVLIDSVQAEWNNWGGIGVFGSNYVTVQNSVANYNGGVGFMSANDQNVLFRFNQSDYNNWRGAQAGLYDWGMGGTKFMFMRNTTVQNHFSYRNQAQGLWFDTDNKNVTINNATLSENLMAALQIEANEGPVLVENSHVCSSGAGINLLNSEKVTIQNNALYNNSGTGIFDAAEVFVAGIAGGHAINDWLTGQYYKLFTTGTVLTGNTFENGGGGQQVFGTYLKGTDWTQFKNTLRSGSNHWYDPTTPTNFMIANGEEVALGGWRGATGQDYSSTWAKPSTSPAGACWVSAPSYADFAVNLSKPSISMSRGSASVPLFIHSYGYGAVNLQISGLPSGVWASFSRNNLASGTVTIQIRASASAGYKTVPITIWAISGSRVHTITVNLNVTPS
jgi:hypothetical protein